MIALMISLLAATPKDLPPDCKRIEQAERTQQEMNFCAGDAWHRADAELNRTWMRVKAIMRRKDAEGGGSCYPAEPNNGPK
jgi:uncharacterized protein YecT (DUF1311 family)